MYNMVYNIILYIIHIYIYNKVCMKEHPEASLRVHSRNRLDMATSILDNKENSEKGRRE